MGRGTKTRGRITLGERAEEKEHGTTKKWVGKGSKKLQEKSIVPDTDGRSKKSIGLVAAKTLKAKSAILLRPSEGKLATQGWWKSIQVGVSTKRPLGVKGQLKAGLTDEGRKECRLQKEKKESDLATPGGQEKSAIFLLRARNVQLAMMSTRIAEIDCQCAIESHVNKKGWNRKVEGQRLGRGQRKLGDKKSSCLV